MEVILVAAVSRNGVIGKGGRLPWQGDKTYSEDLKRLKEMTLGHPVIMGRSTWDSIGGRPLKGRKNIILTRNCSLKFPQGAIKTTSLDEALRYASGIDNEVYVLGGQRVYEESIDRANRMEITWIMKDYEGDTFFPDLSHRGGAVIVNPEKWKQTKELVRADSYGRNLYSFCTYFKR